MSFSSDTKYEICDSKIKKKCCKVSQLYGMVLFAQNVNDTVVKINTENVVAINLVNQLANDVFGINFSIGEYLNSYFAYLDGKRLEELYESFFISVNGKISHSISAVLTESMCCKYAFLRGAFLVGGYVANPSDRYHLEITTPYYSLAKNLNSFLHELDFPSKTVVRNSNYVVYLKESAAIEKFLCLIGANTAAFSFMDVKIYKEMNNYTNRINNTKIHNIEKTLNKSVEQVKAIELIKSKGGFDSLDEDLVFAAKIRLENPDKSLNELVDLCDNKFSRSGLNRRLKKIVEISQQFEE